MSRQNQGLATYSRTITRNVFAVPCDGEGCTQLFDGTHEHRRRAGWVSCWRVIRGTGVSVQIDLCPECYAARGSQIKRRTNT